MTLSRHDWAKINIGVDDVTYEHICQAIAFIGDAIDTLEILQDDVGVYRLTIEHLTNRLVRLIKIKADRTPTRPELPTRIIIDCDEGLVTFHGLTGGPWGVRSVERTQRLRELLTEVYEETKSMKVDL